MSTKKSQLSYFDIFPGAQIKTTLLRPKHKKEEIDPTRLQHFVLSLYNLHEPPKWISVEHRALISRVFVIVLEGLDASRVEKYGNLIPSLDLIKADDFPITVKANEKGGQITPSVRQFIGTLNPQKNPRTFISVEEMILSIDELADNGFPLDFVPGPDPNYEKRRFECYGMQPIKEEDIASYQTLPEPFEGACKVISIDCEMIETDLGDEVARLSCTNDKGETMLDEVFKPMGKVVDLRTHVSGITQEMLDNAKFTSDSTIEVLGTIADKNTIIVGHSLENDFRALGLIHKKVIDTSLLYNKEVTYPRKPSLSNLYAKYIKKPFRTTSGGHDSVDDARAAMDLVNYALGKSVGENPPTPQLPKLFDVLFNRITAARVFAKSKAVNYAGVHPKLFYDKESSESVILDKLIENMKSGTEEFVLGQFAALTDCSIDDESESEAVRFYDKVISSAVEAMPPSCIMIVYTGNGSFKRVANALAEMRVSHDATAKKAEQEACRQGLAWIYASPTPIN